MAGPTNHHRPQTTEEPPVLSSALTHTEAVPSPTPSSPSVRWWRRIFAAALLGGAGLVGAACSDPDVVSSLDEVSSATILLEVDGVMVDPEVGEEEFSSSGSGFFISSDGLAVTNNHVVAGATSIEVFVGDDPLGYQASVVGVSECNDLALVRVEVENDVPYLEWFTGEIRAGLDVYSAGFPLGDPEFTLSRGVVSKARANDPILFTVADVNRAIEHDANIQQGSSGGPLVDVNGRVVGVNFAGTGDTYGVTEQYFAIAADAAAPVVEQLKAGNVESLGLNTEEFSDPDTLEGVSGLWVAGVTEGSTAAAAGLEPGDVLVAMDGVEVGVDPFDEEPDLTGRFYAVYCEVVRATGDAPIGIEVVRTPTGEVLSGDINGDSPLVGALPAD